MLNTYPDFTSQTRSVLSQLALTMMELGCPQPSLVQQISLGFGWSPWMLVGRRVRLGLSRPSAVFKAAGTTGFGLLSELSGDTSSSISPRPQYPPRQTR